jgi:hypothetical protein
LIIDAMVGFACESIGQEILARSRDKLTAEECRGLITALEALDLKREPVDLISRRDRAWFSASHNLLNRIILSVSPGVNQMLGTSIRAFELAAHRSAARLRLLIGELAIRRYKLEKGSDPPSLEALVPAYLAQVPIDPYSGRAIQYRPERDQGHRLYCVGPDGQDDDGHALPERSNWTKVRGDVLVDPRATTPPKNGAALELKTPSAGTP